MRVLYQSIAKRLTEYAGSFSLLYYLILKNEHPKLIDNYCIINYDFYNNLYRDTLTISDHKMLGQRHIKFSRKL